jgi:RecB family exonuclease
MVIVLVRWETNQEDEFGSRELGSLQKCKNPYQFTKFRQTLFQWSKGVKKHKWRRTMILRCLARAMLVWISIKR